MDSNVRVTRSTRPTLSITLPDSSGATFDVDEDGFRTPPIWVPTEPPPIIERPQMKRTASEASSWGGDDDEQSPTCSEPIEPDTELLGIPRRTVTLQDRRSQSFSHGFPKVPSHPPYKRRISDSVATRTRARLLAQQAYSSTLGAATDESISNETQSQVKGERKPVITASALTILTLARSSSNPYSPPIDHEKFTMAGLPLASPFHEKKSYFDKSPGAGNEQIKSYFHVSKNSKKEKRLAQHIVL